MIITMTNLQSLKKKKKMAIILFLSLGFNLINNFALVTGESANNDYDPDQFFLQQGMNRIYLTNLEVNDTWIVTCTSKFEGKFNLYLYDQRPTLEDYLNEHTNYPALGSPLIAYNETSIKIYSYDIDANVNFISVNYTVSTSKLYYVEIKLVEGGPDSFIFSSTVNGESNAIQAYFIPYIAGFQIEFLFISITIGSLLVQFYYGKKRTN